MRRFLTGLLAVAGLGAALVGCSYVRSTGVYGALTGMHEVCGTIWLPFPPGGHELPLDGVPIDSCPGTYAVDDSLRVGWDIGGMAGDNLRNLDREWLPDDYPDTPYLWQAEEPTRAGRMIWRVRPCRRTEVTDAYSLAVSFADYYTVDFGTNCNGLDPLMRLLDVFRAARPVGEPPTPSRDSSYRTGGVTFGLMTTEGPNGTRVVEGRLTDAADGDSLLVTGLRVLGTIGGQPPPPGMEIKYARPYPPDRQREASWFRVSGLRDGDVVEVHARLPDYAWFTSSRFVVEADSARR